MCAHHLHLCFQFALQILHQCRDGEGGEGGALVGNESGELLAVALHIRFVDGEQTRLLCDIEVGILGRLQRIGLAPNGEVEIIGEVTHAGKLEVGHAEPSLGAPAAGGGIAYTQVVALGNIDGRSGLRLPVVGVPNVVGLHRRFHDVCRGLGIDVLIVDVSFAAHTLGRNGVESGLQAIDILIDIHGCEVVAPVVIAGAAEHGALMRVGRCGLIGHVPAISIGGERRIHDGTGGCLSGSGQGGVQGIVGVGGYGRAERLCGSGAERAGLDIHQPLCLALEHLGHGGFGAYDVGSEGFGRHLADEHLVVDFHGEGLVRRGVVAYDDNHVAVGRQSRGE